MSIFCKKWEYQCASETLVTLQMKKPKGKNNYPWDKCDCDYTTSSMDVLIVHMSLNHIEN